MEKLIYEGTAVTPEMYGAMNRWRRMFYGKDAPAGSHPSRIPAVLCSYLATLATGELEVKVTGSLRAKFIAKQLRPLWSNMKRAVEIAAREGACVLHPTVEDGRIRVELIPAHRFFPTRFAPDGRAEAGFFADFRQAGKLELVRLESFDWKNGTLTVENRVYELQGDKLGKELPLDTLEGWRGLEKSVTVEQTAAPMFGVISMPFGGSVDPCCPLPESLLAGAEDTVREFDRLYGELLYELHSGKRKRILERQALGSFGDRKQPGMPGWQDLATDTYLVLDPMEQSKPFDDYSPVIRTEEYLRGIEAMLRLLENQCHLSPGALSLETASGDMTATEVVSRDRTTYNTCRAVQEQGMRCGIEDLVTAVDALCDLYGLCPAGKVETVITFGDSVFEDTQKEFDRRLKLVETGCLKPEKLVAWYFSLPEEDAGDYVQ